MVAAIRPDSWNYALFLHVLGAAVLVGALVTAVAMQALGRGRSSGGAVMFARLSFRTLLLVAVPAWFAMRIGAEWIRSKEFPEGADEPAWLGVGYITAEPGGMLLLVSVVLAGLGARRLARTEGGPGLLTSSATVLTVIVFVAYLVALWAMTAKPD